MAGNEKWKALDDPARRAVSMKRPKDPRKRRDKQQRLDEHAAEMRERNAARPGSGGRRQYALFTERANT